jgi:hypothetical protein
VSTPYQRLAETYRQRWQDARAPRDVEAFLAEFPNPPPAELTELLLLDQSLRWERSAGPPVEDYLRRFPALVNDRQARLDLVYGEMRAARELGIPIHIASYVARFPDLRDDLRRQWEVSGWVQGVSGGDPPPRFRPTRSATRPINRGS